MTKTRRCAGALAATVIMTVADMAGGQSTALPDGTEAKVNFTATGSFFKVDSRTTVKKLHEALPEWVKKHAPMTGHGGQVQIQGMDSLGVGFRIPGIEMPGKNYVIVASSQDGWYTASKSYCYMPNGVFTGYPLAPRSAETITISFYEKSVNQTVPEAPLATLEIHSPRHDPAVASFKSSRVPDVLSVGPYQIKSKGLYTGLYLGPIDWSENSTADCPEPIAKLISGMPRKAVMPQQSMSAYVLEAQTTNGLAADLQAGQLEIYDSKGSKYGDFFSCYQSSGTYALTWPENMPVRDGDYKFVFSLYENPPDDLPEWKDVTLSAFSASSTQTLILGTFSLRVGMTQSNTVINLERTSSTKDDLRRISIEVLDDLTSKPIAFSSRITHPDYNKQQAVLTLSTPLTTGSVTMRIAHPIEHKLAFQATPERPR